MIKYIFIALLFTSFNITAQSSNDFMSKVDQNRIMSMLMEFSGEIEIDGLGTILDRSIESGKGKAREYLLNNFDNLGLTAEQDIFKYNTLDGINIIGMQPGVIYPDSIVIICAHYDSVDEYCADDNASGVSAVLEAAQILSDYTFEKTIYYALWDLEENGLFGSKDYAFEAYNDGLNISAVINADMIGYDGNADNLFEIHTKLQYEQDYLYNKLIKVLNKSSLNLNAKGVSYGASNSDHSPFWNYEYKSVLITQGYRSNDFNPNYHSSMDRVEGIREVYITQIVKLITGTVSEIAVLDKSTNIKENIVSDDVYYNPRTQALIIEDISSIDKENLQIFDIAGRSISFDNLIIEEGSISISELNSGVYYLRIGNKKNKMSKFIKY